MPGRVPLATMSCDRLSESYFPLAQLEDQRELREAAAKLLQRIEIRLQKMMEEVGERSPVEPPPATIPSKLGSLTPWLPPGDAQGPPVADHRNWQSQTPRKVRSSRWLRDFRSEYRSHD